MPAYRELSRDSAIGRPHPRGAMCAFSCAAQAIVMACGAEDPPHNLRDAGSDVVQTPVDAGSDAPSDAKVDATDSASTGDASTDSGPDNGDASSGYPAQLSQTGLYSDISSGALAPGVVAFHPRYQLWSDGAEKQRWLYLPEGSVIDSTEADYWRFPVGTKAFKQFTRDGIRVETRMLHKVGPADADWVMIAYQWNAEQTDAFAVPDGVQNASGTEHDVPSQMDCVFCHEKLSSGLLGVGALQLGHDDGDLNLRTLVESERLSDPPSELTPALPGDATTQAALGYMHANCGTCHNPTSSTFQRTNLDAWLRLDTLATVESTPIYQTAVGVANSTMFSVAPHRIAPGSTDYSEVYRRMTLRTQRGMPPLGTELVDKDGLSAVGAFILGLPALPDGDP